jgi:type IV fimbrial biogenesis protein FimT
MKSRPARNRCNIPSRGFTLIELMIAVTLLAIIAVLAVPAFTDFRERAVIRGSAEQLTTAVAQFRHEGVRRNRFVTATFLGDVGSADWCVGGELGRDVPCDCTDPDDCSLGRFPAGATERRGAIMVGTTGFSADGTVTFDPATGTLTEFGEFGTFTLRSPSTRFDYQLRFELNPLGRASLCVPLAADLLPGYQRCAD